MGLSTPQSDVDVLNVVRPNESTPKDIIEFAQKQVGIQLRYGLVPDLDYPCDVISTEQLSDVLNGRAIINQEGDLIEGDNPNNNEFDYRVWLYEMISHDFDLLGGKLEKLETATGEALNTALLICAIRGKYSQIVLDDLRIDIMRPIGKECLLNGQQTEILIDTIMNSSFSYIKRGQVVLDQLQVRSKVRKLLNIPKKAEYVVPWSQLRTSVR